jgi:hypothetical protein
MAVYTIEVAAILNLTSYFCWLFQDGMTLQDILKSKKAEIEKMCLDKGIPLTRPVNKVLL